jgi:hypothetical protein
MIRRKETMVSLFILVLILLTACNMPRNNGSTTIDPGAIYTQAAQTVMAQLTQQVPLSTQAPTGAPTQPGLTPAATEAAQATSTQHPLATSTTAPSATSVPCNRAEFVRDVSIPDGTEISAGVSFVKVWRLKNTGSCSWTSDYSLVFVNGDDMEGDDTPLPGTVRPGEEVNVSVELVAPDDPGRYRGNWMLSDGERRFGLGANADKVFWVQIEVEQPDGGITYHFADRYCEAEWESDAAELDCPGKSDDEDGFVLRLSNPDLENRSENEPAILTHPEMTRDGWIRGTYPPIRIRAGDRFIADVGCLKGYTDCDVVFQVNYRNGGDALKTFGEWHEVYDRKITRINISLDPLDGEQVEFILTVLANGSARDDAAFWLMPHIYRQP